MRVWKPKMFGCFSLSRFGEISVISPLKLPGYAS